MEFIRWNPRIEPTKQEQILLKRLNRVRKVFGFLRLHRHELFDEGFQSELESMYRATGAGAEPLPPAMMAMAVLLQGYLGASDAEAIELTVVDLRWQMVLDRLGATEPAFSQGALRDFRERLIRTGMDRRLLERTVELARTSREFDWKKLPKTLRVAIDSSPLEGAGRVEDTLNLLAHAARKVVECAATLLKWTPGEVSRAAGIPLLLSSSVKRGLDVEWSDREQKAEASREFTRQLESLQTWLSSRMPDELTKPPLSEPIAVLTQLLEQDLEPDPGGGSRIRRGVAENRRISIEDGEMRHGRKSKSKRFNGYKRHIAADLDTNLILSCAITPANRPEEEAAQELAADIERQRLTIDELHIDRGYINSPVVNDVLGLGGDVVCKPWVARNANGKAFTKAAFRMNMREMTITCPAGEVEKIRPGMLVKFDPDACDHCPLRAQCTTVAPGKGRTISIAEDEKLQHRLRKQIATRSGRARLRERVGVEHRLAHVNQRQGRRARYRGVRRNLFDLRRAAALQNLETIQRKLAA